VGRVLTGFGADEGDFDRDQEGQLLRLTRRGRAALLAGHRERFRVRIVVGRHVHAGGAGLRGCGSRGGESVIGHRESCGNCDLHHSDVKRVVTANVGIELNRIIQNDLFRGTR
jgi:hypothetical protein